MRWVHNETDGSFAVRMNDTLLLKLYPDNRPSVLETSVLQKGVVIEMNGDELNGEGMGFGVPIVKYRDKTFFSGTSSIDFNEKDPCLITKRFTLDMISKKYYKSNLISDLIYRPAHNVFTFFYLKIKSLRFLFDRIMDVRENIGIQTKFVTTKPRGIVSITYRLLEAGLLVEADFSEVESIDAKEHVILNEQGADFFEIYSDSSGIKLSKEKIGAWEEIESEQPTFHETSEELSFSTEVIPGSRLFRGWENVPDRLSWVGLNFSFNPESKKVDFEIYISQEKS
jgi:hypothetical protein